MRVRRWILWVVLALPFGLPGGGIAQVDDAPSLAGVESLISEPRFTSHKGISAEDRAALGIPDGFLRLSCGLEDAADIIGDLGQALEKS